MELPQNILTPLTVILLSACLVSALPAVRSSASVSSRQSVDANEDFRNLVNFLSQLKNAVSQQSSAAWDPQGERDAEGKRTWLSKAEEYDYNPLAGGRWGKRYYGDYGIGGGRFGRDVDHVDLADTSDATL